MTRLDTPHHDGTINDPSRDHDLVAELRVTRDHDDLHAATLAIDEHRLTLSMNPAPERPWHFPLNEFLDVLHDMAESLSHELAADMPRWFEAPARANAFDVARRTDDASDISRDGALVCRVQSVDGARTVRWADASHTLDAVDLANALVSANRLF